MQGHGRVPNPCLCQQAPVGGAGSDMRALLPYLVSSLAACYNYMDKRHKPESPLSRQSHGWGLVALQINLQIQWQPRVSVQRRVHLRSKAGKQDLQAFGGTRTRQVEVYQTIQTGKHMRRSQLSCFPGSLFNPWDSGKARNWFQPGSGQPTSIPEVNAGG